MQSLPNLHLSLRSPFILRERKVTVVVSVVRERKDSCILLNGRLLFVVLLQVELTAFVRTLSQMQVTCTFFLTSDSFEFTMLESESPASDLDLQSFKSTDTGDVLSEPSVFRVLGTWSSDHASSITMTLIRAFRHHGSSELDQMQSSFLILSSEPQVL